MTAKEQEFQYLQEPLLVEADAESENTEGYPSDNDTRDNAPDSSNEPAPLASERQIRGAMWAGGIAGLVVGGPLGAGLGVWGGHHFAKKNEGDFGKFARKAGDFTSRLGANIKRDWEEASSAHRA